MAKTRSDGSYNMSGKERDKMKSTKYGGGGKGSTSAPQGEAMSLPKSVTNPPCESRPSTRK